MVPFPPSSTFLALTPERLAYIRTSCQGEKAGNDGRVVCEQIVAGFANYMILKMLLKSVLIVYNWHVKCLMIPSIAVFMVKVYAVGLFVSTDDPLKCYFCRFDTS